MSALLSPSYQADFAHSLPTMYQTVHLQILTQKMQEAKSDWYLHSRSSIPFAEGVSQYGSCS
jgi:hypothetical protein